MTDLNRLPVAESVRRRLGSALGRLSHAYIISGPDGSGCDQLVDCLAAAFVCTDERNRPCGICADCRKAAGGIHPDIIHVTIPEDKRLISVDQVRKMRADAYIRPNEANRKVFVIHDAQTMREEAQNALLKILEEGPAYAAFLLLVEHPQQLLSTIRSRCETLSLTAERQHVELSDELMQAAGELAARLMGEDALLLMEYTVALEKRKWESDTLSAFMVAVEEALRPALAADPARVLPLMQRLREIRLAMPFHVGTGHLLGWLAAGSAAP